MAFTDRLNRFLNGLSRPGSSLIELPDDLREQLAACLPERVRKYLAQRHRRLIIEPEGALANLSFASSSDRKSVGYVYVDGSTPLPQEVLELGKDRGYSTEILLPAEAVLVRTVSFPAQVRANLAQVISYEMDRLSPFQATEVVFDFALRGGAKRSDRLTLDLALCRRDAVSEWVKRFDEFGVPVDRITWGGAWPHANLLRPEERPRRRQMRLTPTMAFAISAAVLAVATMVTPLWQKTHLLRILTEEVTRLRTEAVAVDDLRKELEAAKQGSTAILKQKVDQPPILGLLRELTDRLPDDTWIQNLEYSLGDVDLRGESAQATALIAVLEQAPGIDSVSFKSPVTQVSRTGKERFNISLRYNPQSAQ